MLVLFLTGFLILLAALTTVLIVTIFTVPLVINYFMFPVPNPSYTQAQIDSKQTPYLDIKVENSDEVIAAYYLNDPAYEYTVVYSHGNGSDIGEYTDWIHTLHTELGVNAIAYDYLGYGQSSKEKPSEPDCIVAINTCMNYLIHQQNVPESKIILMGHSLGTGVTVEATQKYNLVAGVLIVSAFTSIIGVISPKLASILWFLDHFPSINQVPNITSPISLIHGERDSIINYSESQKLYDEATSARSRQLYLIPDGDHTNLQEVAKEEMFESIRSFMV